MEFNGWEKIGEPLGVGGQSTVYLARNPDRARRRKAASLSLDIHSDGAKHAEYADEAYTYSRPDLPDELGALKVFHFRPNSAHPIERLKREIAILKECRLGLPQLLDSNAEQLWMVTQYFKNGTLAEQTHRAKFKGNALECLNAFRGLVETVAALHADNVVHRDIKPSNIFVNDDRKLILGDFGLVYTTNDSDSQKARLTRTGETIGPWEHLPWWAKAGVRLESPTPAVDVFLLGNLLWCLVSGESRFEFGERYRHTLYDLEERFKAGKYMQLINLVLSQCLGDDEAKCVKDAGVLLMVVDEVLDAINKRAPVTDENNILVIPCRFCDGFYEQIHGPDLRGILQLTDEHARLQSPMHLNVMQCGICKNIQLFSMREPFEAFRVRRVARVNPSGQGTGRSRLWW